MSSSTLTLPTVPVRRTYSFPIIFPPPWHRGTFGRNVEEALCNRQYMSASDGNLPRSGLRPSEDELKEEVSLGRFDSIHPPRDWPASVPSSPVSSESPFFIRRMSTANVNMMAKALSRHRRNRSRLSTCSDPDPSPVGEREKIASAAKVSVSASEPFGPLGHQQTKRGYKEWNFELTESWLRAQQLRTPSKQVVIEELHSPSLKDDNQDTEAAFATDVEPDPPVYQEKRSSGFMDTLGICEYNSSWNVNSYNEDHSALGDNTMPQTARASSEISIKRGPDDFEPELQRLSGSIANADDEAQEQIETSGQSDTKKEPDMSDTNTPEPDSSLVFLVLYKGREGRFWVTERYFDQLRGIDLIELCLRSTKTDSEAFDDASGLQLHVLLSTQISSIFRLDRQLSGLNFVSLDLWETSKIPSLQHFLVKRFFSDVVIREGCVRLLCSAKDERLPSVVTASRRFWHNLALNKEDCVSDHTESKAVLCTGDRSPTRRRKQKRSKSKTPSPKSAAPTIPPRTVSFGQNESLSPPEVFSRQTEDIGNIHTTLSSVERALDDIAAESRDEVQVRVSQDLRRASSEPMIGRFSDAHFAEHRHTLTSRFSEESDREHLVEARKSFSAKRWASPTVVLPSSHGTLNVEDSDHESFASKSSIFQSFCSKPSRLMVKTVRRVCRSKTPVCQEDAVTADPVMTETSFVYRRRSSEPTGKGRLNSATSAPLQVQPPFSTVFTTQSTQVRTDFAANDKELPLKNLGEVQKQVESATRYDAKGPTESVLERRRAVTGVSMINACRSFHHSGGAQPEMSCLTEPKTSKAIDHLRKRDSTQSSARLEELNEMIMKESRLTAARGSFSTASVTSSGTNHSYAGTFGGGHQKSNSSTTVQTPQTMTPPSTPPNTSKPKLHVATRLTLPIGEPAVSPSVHVRPDPHYPALVTPSSPTMSQHASVDVYSIGTKSSMDGLRCQTHMRAAEGYRPLSGGGTNGRFDGNAFASRAVNFFDQQYSMQSPNPRFISSSAASRSESPRHEDWTIDASNRHWSDSTSDYQQAPYHHRRLSSRLSGRISVECLPRFSFQGKGEQHEPIGGVLRRVHSSNASTPGRGWMRCDENLDPSTRDCVASLNRIEVRGGVKIRYLDSGESYSEEREEFRAKRDRSMEYSNDYESQSQPERRTFVNRSRSVPWLRTFGKMVQPLQSSRPNSTNSRASPRPSSSRSVDVSQVHHISRANGAMPSHQQTTYIAAPSPIDLEAAQRSASPTKLRLLSRIRTEGQSISSSFTRPRANSLLGRVIDVHNSVKHHYHNNSNQQRSRFDHDMSTNSNSFSRSCTPLPCCSAHNSHLTPPAATTIAGPHPSHWTLVSTDPEPWHSSRAKSPSMSPTSILCNPSSSSSLKSPLVSASANASAGRWRPPTPGLMPISGSSATMAR